MERVVSQQGDLDMSDIIAGGARAYEDALRQEYELARERLQARLKQCSTLIEQKAVREELETLKSESEGRLRGI